MGTGNKDNKKQPPKDKEEEQQDDESGNKEKIHEQIDEVRMIWSAQRMLLLKHILMPTACVYGNWKCSLCNSEVQYENLFISELKMNHTVSFMINVILLIRSVIQEEVLFAPASVSSDCQTRL